MSASVPLWGIREFSDVFLDALVRNEAGQLMFASLYGRDTAIQQLLAAFSLPVSSGGVDRITLKPVEAPPRPGDGVAGVDNASSRNAGRGRPPGYRLHRRCLAADQAGGQAAAPVVVRAGVARLHLRPAWSSTRTRPTAVPGC
jgi:hypothetical protein